MNAVEVKKTRVALRKLGVQYGQLDILVEDVKCQQANRVNSAGFKSQVRYLLKIYSPEKLLRLAKREATFLRKRGLYKQSKVTADQNIQLKRKKK